MIRCIKPSRRFQLCDNWLGVTCSTSLIPQRHYAVRAPSVRRAEAQAKRPRQQRTPLASLSDALPPISFFHEQKTSGVLRSEPEATRRFLEAYLQLGSNATPARMKNLCVCRVILPNEIPCPYFQT